MSRRRERINEVIRRLVSAKLVAEVKDPRMGFVTVLKVQVSDDLTSAEVLVTVMEEEKKKDTLAALNGMKGFLQKDLAKNLGVRVTPVLTFRTDEAAERAYNLESIIQRARETDADHQNKD